MTRITAGLLVLAGAGFVYTPAAHAKTTMCIFDIAGRSGPAFAQAKDYAVAAKTWGADVELEAYVDERLAAEDFKTGKCDAAAISALRGRQFNKFVGSIDSIGAVPTYKHLRVVIDLMTSPKLADKMVSGHFEVAGILPIGAAYVFVNDRSINSVEKAAGKKIAVLDYDKSQAKMVQQLGAQPVASEVINFGTKFNNGQVDIIAAPAIAYQPLELYKGLGSKGGIYRFPLVQLTANILIRKDKFPEGFGQKSREWVQKQFDRAINLVDTSEKQVPTAAWLDIPESDKTKYEVLMRESRIQMTQEGFYDPEMTKILKRVRCKLDGSLGECADKREL
ncbi:putative solute-binding protein [Limnobacter sp.]|uniref:putative solute-binding protein n=1 Tax=Limnobacter sp. TaxID=2003368 RepID=UPI0035135E81